MADLEVLEVVATLDFAHRHVSYKNCLLPVIVESRKGLRPNQFFMEFTVARQPTPPAVDGGMKEESPARWAAGAAAPVHPQ